MQPPSRRTFLALGLITLTTACTGTDGTDAATKAPAPDPDAPVRLRAVAATDTLLSAYDALLGTPGARTALLQPLRAETAQHRAALAQGIPAGSGTPTPGAPTTAPSTSAALATLERQTAQSHLADLDAARPPLARLLASIAAANALHATTLGAPPDQPDPATTPIPSPSATAPSATSPGTALPALQQALSAEHAAQAQRDAWQRLLTTLGTTPPPAAGGYQLPFPVTDAPTATKLAAHLETRLTTVYADLVADLPTPHRRTAATAPSATSPGTALPALQQALSAEHAAVYGYGVVGAHLPDDQQRADART
ncbi:DUF4439 domain-containing protein, partial [Kitasatospora aureofaciens]|uniref:DUF4439 domain-containing protein n=1 Tax=Kitasatospora aureofaciens TaxID=1894 RepID=UPI00068C6199